MKIEDKEINYLLYHMVTPDLKSAWEKKMNNGCSLEETWSERERLQNQIEERDKKLLALIRFQWFILIIGVICGVEILLKITPLSRNIVWTSTAALFLLYLALGFTYMVLESVFQSKNYDDLDAVNKLDNRFKRFEQSISSITDWATIDCHQWPDKPGIIDSGEIVRQLIEADRKIVEADMVFEQVRYDKKLDQQNVANAIDDIVVNTSSFSQIFNTATNEFGLIIDRAEIRRRAENLWKLEQLKEVLQRAPQAQHVPQA